MPLKFSVILHERHLNRNLTNYFLLAAFESLLKLILLRDNT